MSSTPAKAKTLQRPTVRAGRPPRELAGEVDERILDAARRVFMERGLAGASIDEIARIARAGKPTIYARYPTKEALFAAVGMRNAANVTARFSGYAMAGGTLEERLLSVGRDMLKRLLVDDVVDFMRLAAAEARRIPGLANYGRKARERGVEAALEALREAAGPEDIERFPALAAEHLPATAQVFVDLVVGRLLMRALVGESLKLVRSEVDAHVTRSVAFFMAGCRHSGPE